MTLGTQDILIKHNARWLIDIAADAMLIADAGGHILLANPAAERLFGYTRDQFAALGIEDLIPSRFRVLHVDKRADYAVHPISRTMDSRLDIVGLHRDGGEFTADVSLSPLEEGLVLATVYDITWRRQAELALVEAREFAESIVATIQEAMVVLDADERVVSANQIFYRVFRLKEEETLGRVFFELNERQWDLPALRQLLAEVLPNKQWIEAFELQHEFPGIGNRTVLIGARLIKGKDDRSALTLLTFLNITERKRLEAEQVRMIHELKTANEELINFAYVVSHDLKAPLRAIGSLADWIAADQQDRLDTEGREHLRLLIQRVKRMDALIDGVLRYSRIGRIHKEDVVVDLKELVHEVIDLLAPPAHIAVVVAPGLPVIRAEKTAIHQVLQNLIANAIRYMDKPQGRIEIGCADEGESWRFSVADNGPGIETRHFDRIFQLFQTLNPRDRVESTGVGLAIVKKIAEQCGGHVWVEVRTRSGQHLFLQPAQNDFPNTERRSIVMKESCKAILLVEDDQVDAMTVRRALKELHVFNRLEHVENGEEALNYLCDSGRESPCLILLDINMPIMNGIEFLQEVKAVPGFRRIPVVVLTTSDEQKDKVETFDLGVAGYMRKPVDYRQFVEIIRTIDAYWTLSESPV